MKHKFANSVTLIIVLLAGMASHAQVTYTDLYEFDDPHGCCVTYPGLLAQGRDGYLYGGTFSEGKYGYGTAFRMALDGGLTTLHDFDSTDGNGVQGGLSMGLDGNFYGTTYQGGAHHFGTIFQIKPDGTFTTLYNFGNTNDGAYPKTPPVPAADGNLYGVTGNGTVPVAYRITTAGKFTPIATLPSQSYSPLVLGANGLLYGMTEYGGDFNKGTAFTLSTKGVLKVIHSFDGAHGAQPLSPLLQWSDGNFYGTTSNGGPQSGGVVFRLSPSGTYTVLHAFQAGDTVNGYDPTAGLVTGRDFEHGSNLYGLNSLGGALGDGTAFRLKFDGSSYSLLYTFDRNNGGSNPSATPIAHTNGTIYGITQHGGQSDDGVFYGMNAGTFEFASLFAVTSGKIGATVQILGQGFTGAKSVMFFGASANFKVVSDNFLTATVPDGAVTGPVRIIRANGDSLYTVQNFYVTPQILNFSPPSGPVGTVVTITGKSLADTLGVGFGNRKPAQFTVNSDGQVTATVPAGAQTGPIGIQTEGGIVAISSSKFTVTK